MRKLTVSIIAWLGVLAIAGCMEEDCGACPGGVITLHVRDAASMMGIQEVVVLTRDRMIECDYTEQLTICEFGAGQGTHELEVDAAGYVAQSLSVTLPSPYPEEGCGCNDVGATRDVALVPE